MRIARYLQACERWHFKLLGTLWALCGLMCLSDLAWRGYWWEQKTPWVPAVVGIPYIVVGCGFTQSRVWARWCMLPLMLVAALIWLDMLLCGACTGNRLLVWLSVAALIVILYTALFDLFSLCKACSEYV